MAGSMNRFWLPAADLKSATETARNGTWACVAVAFMIGLPTVAGLLSPEAYGAPPRYGAYAAALFLVLGALIWRLSFTAACAALVLWALCWPLGLFRGTTIFSGLILVAAALYLVQGVRGSYACRRLRGAPGGGAR